MHGEFADVYGSSAPSYAHVKFWVGEFKSGRTCSEAEARSGRPLDATDEEMCKKVRNLLYSDRRIQEEEIAQALGVSHGSVSSILHRASLCSALLKCFRSKDEFSFASGYCR